MTFEFSTEFVVLYSHRQVTIFPTPDIYSLELLLVFLPRGFPFDYPVAFKGLAPVVSEPKKIEAVLSWRSCFAMLCFLPVELYQPGLVRVKF